MRANTGGTRVSPWVPMYRGLQDVFPHRMLSSRLTKRDPTYEKFNDAPTHRVGSTRPPNPDSLQGGVRSTLRFPPLGYRRNHHPNRGRD